MGARFIAAVIVGAALPAAAAPALAADASKTAYRVPVTQPDESGAPVALDVDVYLPATDPPPDGRPFVVFFHGGGSDKSNAFDADHARFFAEHGYVTLLYSARGHGDSGGQTSVAGPKEMRDTFDVIAWALGIGGRDSPTHPDFHIDTSRIGLSGYSQGGLNTNLAQAWSSDPELNPYGIRFKAMTPGNTPDVVFNALIPNQVVKLSFGVGLLGTYFGGARGRVAPQVDRWIATAAVDQPALYGGELCDYQGHGAPTSTMRQDLAARSAGCLLDRMTPPSHWAQSFDDTLFTADMAISMWRRMPAGTANRLYLSMGGHGAPSALRSIEKAKLDEQLAFMDHHLRGRPLGGTRVVYWTRDPAVPATSGSFAYRDAAWIGPTGAPTWPPPGVEERVYRLGADGRAVSAGAEEGELPLAPYSRDEANDPVAQTLIAGTPLGSSPPSSPQTQSVPGQVASFSTEPFPDELELSGSPVARLPWTPAGDESQLVLKLLDAAPDGTLTLLSRGVQGMRDGGAGERREVTVAGDTFSAVIRRGHRLVAWVAAGDASFYKQYPESAGGMLGAGSQATLTLPLRGFSPSGAEPHCLPSRLRVRSARVGRLRIGQRQARALAAAGTATMRRRSVVRWCVRGGGAVVAVFPRGARSRLIATTARRHAALGLRPGSRRARLHRRFRTRRLARRLLLARRGRTRVVVGMRRGRVRFLAVTGRRNLKRPRALRRQLRRAGLAPARR